MAVQVGMRPGVIANLVTFIDHTLQNLRIPRGVAPDHVKRRPDPAHGQHIEKLGRQAGVRPVVEGHRDIGLRSRNARHGCIDPARNGAAACKALRQRLRHRGTRDKGRQKGGCGAGHDGAP